MYEFGKTWWGKQWLNSLTHIDHSNRLPRGRNYVRRGLVTEIGIHKNVIKAKVQGTRPSPYKVTITVPEFKEQQKAYLIKAITTNPLLLSRLLNRELPADLDSIASQNHIYVFPSSWKDFAMKCSCPDWAVPCKHLAAVIYILSSEIDKNPFILFTLHGLDILKELNDSESGRDIQYLNVPPASGLYDSQTVVNRYEPSSSIKEVFDLTLIPDLREQLLALLEPKPLFHSKAFLPILMKLYKFSSKKIKDFIDEDIDNDHSSHEYIQFENVEILLTKEVFYADTIFYSVEGEKHFHQQKGFEHLVGFLHSIPAKYAIMMSPSLIALHRVFLFSMSLIETGAFIPQILKLYDNSYYIRWIPFSGNEEVENLLHRLEKLTPPGTIKILRNRTDPLIPGSRETVVSLVSLFLGYFIHSSSNYILPGYLSTEEKVEALFFTITPQKFTELGEMETPGSIYQWLNRLYLSYQSLVPVIKIEDNSGNFYIELLIENKKDSFQPLIPFKEFMVNKNYSDTRIEILKTLASLTPHFKDIELIIKSSGQKELVYNPDSFVTVLFNILPVVKLMGIRMLLPEALKFLVRPQISLRLQPDKNAKLEKRYLSLTDMLNFNWAIALGHLNMPADEFLKLVKGMSGVVRIKEQYVLIDQNEIKKLIENLKERKDLNAGEMLKTALTEEYMGAKITISNEARQMIDNLLKAEQKAVPEGLHGTLRPYQERGFHWLYNNSCVGFGSIIADDMGLGKTIQVITLLLQFNIEERIGKQKVLIIVPTTLITNWQKELQHFAPELSVCAYHGSNRTFDFNESGVVITSYGVVRSDIKLLQKMKWAAVIIDEAQNIKNPESEQTKAVKQLKSPVKIAMSGTPVENRLIEYWSIFDFINKGYMGSLQYFRNEFARPIEVFNDEKKLERFKKITSPFILRRLKTDKSIIADLPEKIENTRYVNLTKEQTALYQNVVDNMMPDVENPDNNLITRAGLIFKLITALKQICNHPSHFLKRGNFSPELSGKATMLIDILRNIFENNEKVLIFTQYKEMGEILKVMIRECFGDQPLFLHGGVLRKQRDEMVNNFQEKSLFRAFILSLKAGGTGLNLTGANHVIHYDLWWNPAVESQATDRSYRIGQQKNVMVYRMISKGTFEEKINDMLQQKKDLANLTVSVGEKWIGNLSNTALNELIKL